MRIDGSFLKRAFTAAFLLAIGAFAPRPARAHCDTLDGPVVKAARAALESGDVAPVLKWVKPEGEAEVRAAFLKTLAVRGAGREARELADTWFFETLVRVHRAGEGAPYTGLKPAGTDPGPAVTAADRALESGSVDALVMLVTEEAAAGIRARFRHALEAKHHAEQNVAAGREFVAAYVEYVHYVERLYQAATRPAGHDEAAEGGAAHSVHQH